MQTKFEIKEKQFAKSNLDYLDEIPIITFTVEEPIIIPKKKVLSKTTPPKVINNVIEIVPDETSEKDISKTEAPSKNEINVIPPFKKEDPQKN